MDAACYSKFGVKDFCFYSILYTFIPIYYYLYLFHNIIFFKYFSNIFFIIFGGIAHNVPAVGDVFAARIRALRSKDQGWQNVPEQRRGNERSD
jgi:hypothetical protein